MSLKGRKPDEKKDFSTYLVDRGAADIFFPTNFELLRIMYERECGKNGQYLKTSEFVKEFSRETWA